jgi:hypothetical protein
MTGPLPYQLALALFEERLRDAERRRTRIGQRPRTARQTARPAR